MKRILSSMALLIAASGHAQGNCGKPEAFVNAFNSALTDSQTSVRVQRVVNVQDRREYGCHLILDMDNGDQIGGLVTTEKLPDAQWIPDDDREVLGYEQRVIHRGLVLSRVDPPESTKPPGELTVPPEIRARLDANPRPVDPFNPTEICGGIGPGLPPDDRIAMMNPQVNSILIDIGKTKEDRLLRVKQLARGGMSKTDTDAALDTYRIDDWRIRYQSQLYNVLVNACIPFFMSQLR